jgi:hypothetical protein
VTLEAVGAVGVVTDHGWKRLLALSAALDANLLNPLAAPMLSRLL